MWSCSSALPCTMEIWVWAVPLGWYTKGISRVAVLCGHLCIDAGWALCPTLVCWLWIVYRSRDYSKIVTVLKMLKDTVGMHGLLSVLVSQLRRMLLGVDGWAKWCLKIPPKWNYSMILLTSWLYCVNSCYEQQVIHLGRAVINAVDMKRCCQQLQKTTKETGLSSVIIRPFRRICATVIMQNCDI